MTNELAIRILTGDVLGTTEQTQEAIEMAVKALSNTNGETIYRQDAIDLLQKWSDGYKYIETETELAIKDFQHLPSAQQWIPCSERLPEHPENDDYYLVTIQCEHYDGWDDYVTGFAEWTKHGWDELSCYIGQIKVVAWMPIPEPYEGDSDGTC